MEKLLPESKQELRPHNLDDAFSKFTEQAQGAAAQAQSRSKLLKFIQDGAIVRRGERHMLNKNGSTPNWMIDLRAVTLNGEVLQLIADLFWQKFCHLPAVQIAGLEMGAIPLVSAIVLRGQQMGIKSNGLVIRKSKKKYGLFKQIEGTVNHDPVIVVDDLIHSGTSLEQVRVVLQDSGIKVLHYFTLVDYQTPRGTSWKEESGGNVVSLFSLDELGLKYSSVAISLRNEPPREFTKFEDVWTFRSSGRPDLFNVFHRSTPVVQDDLCFFGSTSGVFSAVNLDSGELVWEHHAGKSNPKGISGAACLFQEFVIWTAYDGNVYCASQKSGEMKWIAQIADYIGSSAILIHGLDLIVVGLEHERAGHGGSTVALDARSGKVIWENSHQHYQHASAGSVPKFNLLVIGSNDCDVQAMSVADGRVLWKTSVPGQVKMAPGICEALDLAVVGCMDGSVVCLDLQTGHLRGSVKADFAVYGTPCIVGTKAYFTSTDKFFYVLDLITFRLIDKVHTRARVFSSPVELEDSIFFGNNSGFAIEYSISQQRLIGKHQLPDRVVAALAFCPRRRFFLANSSDGRLFSFRRAPGMSCRRSQIDGQ